MNVVLVAIGTRGDVAPMAGLGMRLKEAGHDVAFATQATFADLIRDCGLEVRLIPGDTRAAFGSDAGRGWQRQGIMSPRGLRGAFALVTEMYRNLEAGIVGAAAGADVLLLGRVAFDQGYLVAKAMGIPSVGLDLFPSGFAPTTEFLPAGAGGRVGPAGCDG